VKELGYLGPAIRDHEHFSGAAQVEQWTVNPKIAPETAYFRVVHVAQNPVNEGAACFINNGSATRYVSRFCSDVSPTIGTHP
jgi:hypothetical protein